MWSRKKWMGGWKSGKRREEREEEGTKKNGRRESFVETGFKRGWGRYRYRELQGVHGIL